MESKNKVLEALQMQPLSEEEKSRRHILGRLWGPIATSKEKTRNGRGYNAQLWDKALKDEIFREKVANKSLFLELGHPVDREETDMSVVCACIPELPKVIDGDLYAYVDILDTKQGKILKTLCDYGFIPGISSRGSGDIMDNDEVDPETFFLETWDIVQLPAVKKARLTMCESLNNKRTLKKALKESFEQMSDEELEEAKAALERFDIDMDFDDADDDLNWLPGEGPTHNLAEETESVEAVLTPADQDAEKEDEKTSATPSETPEAPEAEEEKNDKEPLTEAEDEDAVAEEEETIENSTEEATEAFTVKDFIDSFADYDDEFELEFTPIEIEGQTITITEVILDDEDDKVKISFNYDLETSDNIEDTEKPESEDGLPEEEQPEAEDDSDEATDDGEDEVIESLKEMVRQKDALEEEVLTLKDQKAVSDAEVGRLKEELERYKTGFMRVSELASTASKLTKEVKNLKEQLDTQETTIQNLKATNKTRLTESAEASNRKYNELQERLIKVQNEAEATEQGLREQVDTARAKTREVTAVAKAYKQRYVTVVEHYIASKASMLGVSTRDITSKLKEGYTLEDVDRVCETLLEAGRPAFGFTRGAQSTAKMKVNEPYKNGSDDDLQDLYELAGLI
jgi:hypothetical protein